jgi:hypothetical protein
MNTQVRRLLYVSALLVLAALLWWLVSRQKAAIAGGEQPSPTERLAEPDTRSAAEGKAEVREKELKQTFETLNDNPIAFYGRAVDQFGAGVSNAAVTGIVLFNTGEHAGERRHVTTTDGDGYFQFTGLRGQDIGIQIDKAGYEYHPRNTSFSYTYLEADHKRHIPDPKSPVIFPLWMKQGDASVVQYRKTLWKIPADGSAVHFNLANGEVDRRDADLVLTLTRDPLRLPFGGRGFAWRVAVEVVGGGLVPAGERDYYNIAPEEGYQSIFEHSESAQSLPEPEQSSGKWTWRETWSGDFFTKSHGGRRYGLVELKVHAGPNRDNEPYGAVEIAVRLNPNGSRNLERADKP